MSRTILAGLAAFGACHPWRAGAEVTFAEHLLRDGYGYAFAVMSADLDGDGDQDLTTPDILGNPSISSIYWFENDGHGAFQESEHDQG